VEDLKNRGLWGQARPFVKGGIWMNFLTKYTQSNLMHKRGAFISRYLNRVKEAGIANQEILDQARREMYQAQCNCGYWHGLFGGLYLGHLRSAIYEHYAKAETLIDRTVHSGADWADTEIVDYDADGNDEVILRNRHSFIVLHPAMGAAVATVMFLIILIGVLLYMFGYQRNVETYEL
jgi:alpha-amylase